MCVCVYLPGVLLGTTAIAVLTKYTFPYNWTWTEALLFGAMMAATDPVATVAVLGEVCIALLHHVKQLIAHVLWQPLPDLPTFESRRNTPTGSLDLCTLQLAYATVIICLHFPVRLHVVV